MFHTVPHGETMGRIAETYGSTVAAFQAANPNIVDADHIFPGQQLRIPKTVSAPPGEVPAQPADVPAAVTSTYTVASGDSMKGIASRFGLSLTQLIEANPNVANPDLIRLGQVLAIPPSGPEAPPPSVARPTTSAAGRDAPAPTAPTKPRRPRHDWSKDSADTRMLYVMRRLVDYGYPVNGAAGIVGNLFVESGLIPNRLQGSVPASPMRAPDFKGHTKDFTPRQIMRRNDTRKRGPLLAGVGLAQWTWGPRRKGLFAHTYNGKALKARILFSMDAQIDYLVTELRTAYTRVGHGVGDPKVTVDRATDVMLYEFEVPASVIKDGTKLPLTDPAVQAVVAARRPHAHDALDVFRSSHQ